MTDYISRNPATGEVYATYAQATDAEIAAALTETAEGYQQWHRQHTAQRTELLGRVAALFREDAEHLATILTEEMGKPVKEAQGEVRLVADIFDYYATHTEAFLEDEVLDSPVAAKVRLQSQGVVLGIMPWNFPYYQVARFVAPNIALGNTVMVKHAPNCPRAALAFVDIFERAGAPQGVYRNIFAGHEQIEGIIADRRVIGVSLTGSERAGAAVAEIAGRHLKKCVLELGGSDPLIVCDSADVATAAKTAVYNRNYNAGQTCTASKRLLVHRSCYEEFVAVFLDKLGSWVPGDPAQSGVRMGPLSSTAAAENIQELYDDALAHGATALQPGGKGDGAFFAPAVLTDISEDARLYSEEAFGPLASIYTFDSDEEALAIANSSAYGLSASVFSGDDEQWEFYANNLEVGMVWRNSAPATSPELPFGGVKNSGFGRELGRYGLEEFANKKLICG